MRQRSQQPVRKAADPRLRNLAREAEARLQAYITALPGNDQADAVMAQQPPAVTPKATPLIQRMPPPAPPPPAPPPPAPRAQPLPRVASLTSTNVARHERRGTASLSSARRGASPGPVARAPSGQAVGGSRGGVVGSCGRNCAEAVAAGRDASNQPPPAPHVSEPQPPATPAGTTHCTAVNDIDSSTARPSTTGRNKRAAVAALEAAAAQAAAAAAAAMAAAAAASAAATAAAAAPPAAAPPIPNEAASRALAEEDGVTPRVDYASRSARHAEAEVSTMPRVANLSSAVRARSGGVPLAVAVRAATALQAGFRGARARAMSDAMREYEQLVTELRGWRRHVAAVVRVQSWVRALRVRRMRRRHTGATVQMQALARGRAGRRAMRARRTALAAALERQKARAAEAVIERERARLTERERAKSQRELTEWLSTGNRSRRGMSGPGADAMTTSHSAALRVPAGRALAERGRAVRVPLMAESAAFERDVGDSLDHLRAAEEAPQPEHAHRPGRWGPSLPPPPSANARAAAAARAARAYRSHLDRNRNPPALPPEPVAKVVAASAPSASADVSQPISPSVASSVGAAVEEPSAAPPTADWFGGVGDWFRTLLPGADGEAADRQGTPMPQSAAGDSAATTEPSGLFARTERTDVATKRTTSRRGGEAWTAAVIGGHQPTPTAKSASTSMSGRPFQPTTSFDARVVATQRLQAKNTSRDTSVARPKAVPLDGKPPAAKVMQLTTSFGARVLATRQIQEETVSIPDAGAASSSAPMRAIDKDGVLWQWTDETGWRMLGDEAPPQPTPPQPAAQNMKKRSAAEVAAASESRRRILGLAPSPSRANAAWAWPLATMAGQSSAPPLAGMGPAGARAEMISGALTVTPGLASCVEPAPPATREWSCAGAADVGHCESARRELRFAARPGAVVRPTGAVAADDADEGPAMLQPPKPFVESPRHQRDGVRFASARVGLSKKATAATSARLYESGGRKSFAAIKERTSVQKVEAAVGTLVEATRLKPIDTNVISRTVGRADHALLRAECMLFFRKTGETLGAALLRLGDSDAKTVLCGVVQGVEHWSDELPADEHLAQEQADFLHDSAIDEATLSAAAVHVFATASDEQVLALKAAYRVRYRDTVDSLLNKKLLGPIHSQLRDLLLARCGVARSRPAAAEALAEFVDVLVATADEGAPVPQQLDHPDHGGGGIEGRRETGSPVWATGGYDAEPPAGAVNENHASDTMNVSMTCAAAPPSLRDCTTSAPSLMLLQQPDGKARRLPGGYGTDVPSDRLASSAGRLSPVRQLRERTPQYAPDRMPPQRKNAGLWGFEVPLASANEMAPRDDIANEATVGLTMPAPMEAPAPSEADLRRNRWAVEQQQLSADMEALQGGHSFTPRAGSPASPLSPGASEDLAHEEHVAGGDDDESAEWRRWEATLELQAAARGWATRRRARGRPVKLGPPVAHPMTRLVVPASKYFTLSGQKNASTRRPKHGTASPSAHRSGVGRAPTSTSASAARSVVKSNSGAMTAQKHAREALDAQLQAELERSRQRQVQSIMLTSFDR